MTTESFKDAADFIKKGKVGVIPTDTIYGLVCSADNKSAVERIFKLKQRDTDKPLIILISKKADILKFKVALSKEQKLSLNELLAQSAATSVILPCENKKFSYIHRGKNSLAFRIPSYKPLLSLIRKTGPIVAPSANPQGQAPSQSIDMAKKYFGDSVDFYLEAGPKQSKASAIIRLNEDGSKEFVRQN